MECDVQETVCSNSHSFRLVSMKDWFDIFQIASDSIEKKDEGGKGEESLLEDSVFIRDPFKTVEEQYKEQVWMRNSSK